MSRIQDSVTRGGWEVFLSSPVGDISGVGDHQEDYLPETCVGVYKTLAEAAAALATAIAEQEVNGLQNEREAIRGMEAEAREARAHRDPLARRRAQMERRQRVASGAVTIEVTVRPEGGAR